MSEKSVSSIIKDNLCTGCGTCVSLCPHDAIELRIDSKKGIYIPNIDLEVCNDCGICRRACPGGEVDFNALNIELFGKKPDDNLLGNYINCYTGYSTDESIRYNSSSGGLVTTLLIFALEEGIIDGALVTRMKKDKPLEPEPFIARTREEIIEASKSKYCPVPANIALKKILESSDGERFAVVGLPCHIHGIRKAQHMNAKLRESIVLCLGLFCEGAPSFYGTKFLLNRMAGIKEKIEKLDYRSNGWPGGVSITSKNRCVFIPHKDVWHFFGQFFYYPKRCTLCCDGLNDLSDISFGDAWIPEYSNDNRGTSLLLSRSNIGDQLLIKSQLKSAAILSKVDSDKVVHSQKFMLYYKKVIALQSKLNKNKPTYKCNHSAKFDLSNLVIEIVQNFNIYISNNRILAAMLNCVPLKIIRIYGLPISLIILMKSRNFFKKL